MKKSKITAKSGIYTLLICVTQPVRIEVGRLGHKDFALGIYTYTGSAIGRSINLRTRVSRHLRFRKKLHWHIDYLLTSKVVVVIAVIYVETTQKKECQVAKGLEQLSEAQASVKGFGASDCLYECESHLHYFSNLVFEEVLTRVVNVYKEIFRGSPYIIFHVE